MSEEKDTQAEIVQAEPEEIEVVREDEAHAAIDMAINENFREAIRVARDTNRFADIEPGSSIDSPIPDDWMPGEPQKDRMRAWRIAHYALMSKRDCPVGLTLSGRAVEVMMKFMENFQRTDKPLNMGAAVEMPAPQFEEIEVDE